jgi:hypothetical protein
MPLEDRPGLVEEVAPVHVQRLPRDVHGVVGGEEGQISRPYPVNAGAEYWELVSIAL